MINFSVITQALETQIETHLASLISDGAAAASRYYVKRSNYINGNVAKTPWIGIYRGAVSYEPRSIGRSNCNWRATPTIRVVVQAASRKSGEQAEERCEAYTQEVLNGILSDYSIGGTVETITGFNVEPTFQEDDNASLHFHMNIITVTVIAKAGFVSITNFPDPWDDNVIWNDNAIWQEVS